MRKVIGPLLIVAGVLSLITFFFAPSVPGERASQAARADYGAAIANPRSIYLYAGVALLAGGTAVSRRR